MICAYNSDHCALSTSLSCFCFQMSVKVIYICLTHHITCICFFSFTLSFKTSCLGSLSFLWYSGHCLFCRSLVLIPDWLSFHFFFITLSSLHPVIYVCHIVSCLSLFPPPTHPYFSFSLMFSPLLWLTQTFSCLTWSMLIFSLIKYLNI